AGTRGGPKRCTTQPAPTPLRTGPSPRAAKPAPASSAPPSAAARSAPKAAPAAKPTPAATASPAERGTAATNRSGPPGRTIVGDAIVYHHCFGLAAAVSTDRGLVVPVLRNAESRGLGQIEQAIRDFGERARGGALQMEELTGGTFTITNGGIFGSLMSTPILNPPQSGILGMHKIQQRPVVVDDKIEARPMMYLALTYDHRLVD